MAASLHNGKIRVNDYTIVKKLGEGGFGVTYLARRAKDMYAIKEMEYQDAKVEFSIMKKLANRCDANFLCPRDFIRSGRYAYVITDFIKGHDLLRYIDRDKNKVTQGFMHRFIEQMLLAVATIHELGVAHRDIKVENIMVSPNHSKFTLIDFGLGETRTTTEAYGTKLYVSPLVYELKNEGKKIPLSVLYASDLFALGVTMFELLEGGKYPFKRIDMHVNRTTPFSNSKEKVPYDVNEEQHYITSKKATAWMRALYPLMTTFLIWHDYEGFFTAEALYDAVSNKEWRVIKDTETLYDVTLPGAPYGS